MDDLTHRNFLSVQQAVGSLEATLQKQQIEIQNLKESITKLSIIVTELQQNILSLQARHLMYGNGPTVR